LLTHKPQKGIFERDCTFHNLETNTL
jgi:hypothetical protein